MSERRRGRVHDAEGAREAILNAAGEAFAHKGFDGARIDAIAEAAGYNKSLIFHYFEDKLGLYTAVLRRQREQGEQFLAKIITPLISDVAISHDADTFRAFLEAAVGSTFDYFLAHPQILHILAWEAAEGWKTTTKIIKLMQLDLGSVDRFKSILYQAQAKKLIRPDYDTSMIFIMALSICQSYLTSIPRYQFLFKDDHLSSPEALARAREQIVRFVIHGTMADPPEAKL
ncbi:MAG TPA: TetR/AcrR family transcriptional regulator [Ktedonobacteraceae bacterium]|nr:TetR/AcrR family transcriptional regulator [Ktedonobacteraceae bacterium]